MERSTNTHHRNKGLASTCQIQSRTSSMMQVHQNLGLEREGSELSSLRSRYQAQDFRQDEARSFQDSVQEVEEKQRRLNCVTLQQTRLSHLFDINHIPDMASKDTTVLSAPSTSEPVQLQRAFSWHTPEQTAEGPRSLRLCRDRGFSFSVCPAVSYSPTLFRVQYHRRCGS